uniref:Endoribonuclease L-PSP/chorismate mutase-like domain-containing protein n=1 Tax=Ditylum brightwellii TaxID=49249 RepID=A0A6U3RNV6_9STRA|mmetsp:Transcript_27696/g.41212  ORF Transcript_27696/g.41212 Transcript_27696/m.41212 type:complete len:222 (+) Transcript_27696:29-694(+)
MASVISHLTSKFIPFLLLVLTIKLENSGAFTPPSSTLSRQAFTISRLSSFLEQSSQSENSSPAMGKIEQRLAELGIEIPSSAASPKGNYVPAVRYGNILHLCGHIPQRVADKSLITGKLGVDLSVEQGYESARTCAINILGTLQAELGTLDKVEKIIKVVGFVNCSNDFDKQANVINGASDLFGEVFGKEVGQHARSAVGSNALPLGIATEVECIVAVKED